MQMVLGASSLWYRRVITGAVLHALLVSAIAMPIAIGVTGLAIGPQPLRERIRLAKGRIRKGLSGFYLFFLCVDLYILQAA